ncbi:hypothetical protein [Streptomyces sp. NBC_00690]|uniref:hypothetical protein n=1 Tax=Streptomyces sp. NBC_00690 TaxID=2975808 RepID=UPI002E2AA1C3|nr:hypothetical protein [Streptomyces sp. NBC_00690]
MTACAIESAARDTAPEAIRTRAASSAFTITANGAYGARLAGAGEALFPERWTLRGSAPHAVPLPLAQPEEAGTDLQPLADGRVLIRRPVAGRHLFSLLYPAGPGTGELPIGGIETPDLVLLPPAPDGRSVYAIAPGERVSAIWLVTDGAFGPEQLAVVPGHCSGGVWLDREGRMLALDRRLDGGPRKSIAVDLRRRGEVMPLLQVADGSEDRLLLADADSGLLLIRSDAPGRDRLGWGVWGSGLPIRFPKSLQPTDPAVTVTPFALQSGRSLAPERCAVALCVRGGDGSAHLGVWRPEGRRLHQRPGPDGWLTGAGWWDPNGVLGLPVVTPAMPCAIARIGTASVFTDGRRTMVEALDSDLRNADAGGVAQAPSSTGRGVPGAPDGYRPIPLQQAPLGGRIGPG